MDNKPLKYVIEAALLAAGRPLSIDKLQALFASKDDPTRQGLRAAIMDLQADFTGRGIELVEVANGFRIQIRSSMTHQLEKLWEERPPRYSRALLETLSIIVYRQPVTRGEIEDIRGVAVSTNIVRTLLERNWIRVVGHRDVPGKPAMFATTKEFLDYFGLKKIDELPPLSELKDFDSLNIQLDFPDGETGEKLSVDDNATDESAVSREFAGADEAAADFTDLDIDDSYNVASLDVARAVANAHQSAPEPVAPVNTDADDESATVLPLNKT
ncbi:MAG TPA: SMC-Scp complex subunit ScpB [Gammaproteobacteria bacterium]|jgi:segregation and condensation protein B|nr:SMC-Scp complex subunit ScpB [Gammaproteobacteria bacterium]HJP39977.1 SMC-Scp complex subunit ScpB [Gammaproteobacteria bacterium]